MGMFTEVLDPITDVWVQFKTGEDGCNRYRLGGVLPYEADDNESDVFCALGNYIPGKGCNDYLVVVKDKRIVAVIKSANVDDEDYDTLSEERAVLRRLYMIEPYQSFKTMAKCVVHRPTWLGRMWERAWPWSSLNKYSRHLRKPGTMEAMALPLVRHMYPRLKRPDIASVKPMEDNVRGVVVGPVAKVYYGEEAPDDSSDQEA